MITCSLYIRTLTRGLFLHLFMVDSLISYTNVDEADCSNIYTSVYLGVVCFFSDNLVSWCFKRQPVVFRSSVETEYQDVYVFAGRAWLQKFLLNSIVRCLVLPLSYRAMYLSSNPI